MHYIISFDVASLIVSLTIFIIHFKFYSKEEGSFSYRFFLISIAVCSVLDIFSAWGIEQVIPVSDFINTVLSTAYMISIVIVHYYAFKSVAYTLKFKSKTLTRINHAVLMLCIDALLVNMFTGFIFSFQDHTYIKTILFHIPHAVCTWFMATYFFIIIGKRKSFTTFRFYISLLSVLTIFIPAVIQIEYPSLLLVPLGTTCIAFILLFSLETPEYAKLQAAKRELEEARANEILVREQLEKSNAEKTVFLKNMSHEFRTPINAIMGFNKMIQFEKTDEETMQKTQSIETAGKMLLKLVGDILDFSQIETSRLDIHPEEYEAISLYIYNMRADENFIDVDIPRCLYGDVNRIRQVLNNLYTYGKDNAPDSHVSFKLSSLGIADDSVQLKFTYKFSTLAIDEFKTELVKQGSFSDELLPLAIAYKILSNMDSELKIFSASESGTVFTFELKQKIIDIKEIGDLNIAWNKYETSISNKNEELDFIAPDAKILAVDDVKLNLKVLGGLLSKFKIDLSTVTSGADAVKFMEENEVDLIFMDIMMPDMDGVETMHAIRSNPLTKSVSAPIIALTANVTVGAKETYLEEGFNGYLSKPISVQKIGLTLKRFLPTKIEEDWEEILGIDAEGKAI